MRILHYKDLSQGGNLHGAFFPASGSHQEDEDFAASVGRVKNPAIGPVPNPRISLTMLGPRIFASSHLRSHRHGAKDMRWLPGLLAEKKDNGDRGTVLGEMQ